ncbi:MAG: diguanylate cyclase [Alphaproteobacteria bacterium]|nr:diguanylate cyclase [Alphaproteobacteria bacterium]
MNQAKDIEQALATASLGLLQTHRIPPTPENYTVWYHYAAGKNASLKEEIDRVIAQKIPFTVSLNASLYQRFFVTDRNNKMVDDAAITAQKMLKDVLKAVGDFSGDTQDYNKDLGHYIETISKDYGDADVKDIIKELVGATVNLKERGEQMNQRLEESKLEIDKLRQNLQQVTSEAQRDGLTGLFNRRTFERMLEEYMATMQEQRADLCLIMLDVDHFKKFNDTYGHLLGDEVLKIVARTLTDSLKGRDVVARFGGEEFVVVLPSTPMDGAMRVADAIRLSIANKELKRKDTGQNFGQITVSLGISRYRHGVDDIPALIKRADEALYESKRLGRNRVTRES